MRIMLSEKRRRRMWVIYLLATNEGITNTEEIAEELGVSRRTVQNDLAYMKENRDWRED